MGMYTLMVADLKLKDDTPKEIANILNMMVNEDWDTLHSASVFGDGNIFFDCDRSRNIFRMDSCSFPPYEADRFFDGKRLLTISSLKNYSTDGLDPSVTPIGAFFSWIRPYCEYDKSNPMIGVSVYEEDFDEYNEEGKTNNPRTKIYLCGGTVVYGNLSKDYYDKVCETIEALKAHR